MKFHFRKIRTLFLLCLLSGMVISCSTSKQGGVSTPKKKRSHKKCDCPRWTFDTENPKSTASPYA